jgi:ubiquinone/menaquinone biosynthesis C-methylase UbiE
MHKEDPQQQRTRNKFSQLAAAYTKYRRDYPERVYELTHEFCPNKNAQVLDVGCGTGIATKHLASYYATVVGRDKEEGMLEVARLNTDTHIAFLNSAAESMSFEAETFDLVTAASAYHWFDYGLAGKEIWRVLKPGGKLCVFWRQQRDKTWANLPLFAFNNLKHFVSDVPRSNKEPIRKELFHDDGFRKVDMRSLILMRYIHWKMCSGISNLTQRITYWVISKKSTI